MAIICTYEVIIDALDKLTKNFTTDRVSSVQVECALYYLFWESFILTGLSFKHIFYTKIILSECFQNVDIDLLTAINYMQNSLKKIKKFWCDEEFNILIDEIIMSSNLKEM